MLLHTAVQVAWKNFVKSSCREKVFEVASFFLLRKMSWLARGRCPICSSQLGQKGRWC